MHVRPIYTSMKCNNDQEFNDEPYAIFVGLKWNSGIPTFFARRTKVYTYVDDGEARGNYNSKDDVNLTKTGKYENIDPNKFLILVQAMENDNSSAKRIVKTLNAVLSRVRSFDNIGTILRSQSKSRIKSIMKDNMLFIIKIARFIPSDAYLKNFINDINRSKKIGNPKNLSQFLDSLKAIVEVGYDILNLLVKIANPDDIIGSPKELALNNKRKEITFSKDGASYTYKFSIHGL